MARAVYRLRRQFERIARIVTAHVYVKALSTQVSHGELRFSFLFFPAGSSSSNPERASRRRRGAAQRGAAY